MFRFLLVKQLVNRQHVHNTAAIPTFVRRRTVVLRRMAVARTVRLDSSPAVEWQHAPTQCRKHTIVRDAMYRAMVDMNKVSLHVVCVKKHFKQKNLKKFKKELVITA